MSCLEQDSRVLVPSSVSAATSRNFTCCTGEKLQETRDIFDHVLFAFAIDSGYLRLSLLADIREQSN